MKKLFTLILLLAAFTGLRAQEQPAQRMGEGFSFPETEYDFGKIPQGKPVYHFFEVKNISLSPLKIENVTASCGCTTPEWSREEIQPGQTSRIKVGFNAAADGPFDKSITVTYNGNTHQQIRIRGTVWKAPAGSAPANSSVQFLKQQIQ